MKKILFVILGAIALALITIAPLAAQEAPAPDVAETVTVQVDGPIQAFIVQMAAKYTWLVAVFSAMGALRTLFKPTIAAARAYAKSTESTKDDQIVDAVEQSKITKGVLFVIDLFISVPLKKK